MSISIILQFIFVSVLFLLTGTIALKIKKNWEKIEKERSEKGIEGRAMLCLVALTLSAGSFFLLVYMTICTISYL